MACELIYHRSFSRFYSIVMAAFAAVLGALPLIIGVGSELRRPLGSPIVEGPRFSRALPLRPVIHLWCDRQSRYLE